MSIANKMSARIQIAANAGVLSPTAQDKFDAKLRELSEWLSEHCKVDVEARASLEDVSQISSYDWTDEHFETFPGFEFEVIRDNEAKKSLFRGLSARSNEDREKTWGRWLSNHPEGVQECLLIAVYMAGDERPAGYVRWNSDVLIDSLDDDATSFDGQSHDLILEIELAALYVVPELRGTGFGSALRWAVVEHTLDRIGKIAEIPSEKRTEMGNPPLRIFFTGEAGSVEGALVANSIAESIDCLLQNRITPYSPWFDCNEIEDDFDYDNFLDKASLLPEPVARISIPNRDADTVWRVGLKK